jgi:membrane peptidoglycan carboxypeptidase
MNNLLQEVTRSGTAARAQATLKRTDLHGKTGTTNDSVDAWFAGYQPTLAAVTWIGYDKPRNLGSRETGGGLSLPVWINFMERALKGVPVMEPTVPPGVVNVGAANGSTRNTRAMRALRMSAWKTSPPLHRRVAPQAPPPPKNAVAYSTCFATDSLQDASCCVFAVAPHVQYMSGSCHCKAGSVPDPASANQATNRSDVPDCCSASRLSRSKNSPAPLVSCQAKPSNR